MITDRIDNIIRIPAERMSLTPPVPKSVKIELTGKCNYHCKFCSLNVRNYKGSTMSWELFTKITLEMRELGVEEIGLFLLGESFTEPLLLVDAIKWLKLIGTPYVFLTSNGSLARPDVVEDCMKAGLDSLKWSVNFCDENQFEEITGAKRIVFWKAVQNIVAAKSIRDGLRYETKLYASSIRYDDKQVKFMDAFLNEYIIPYVDQHYWLPLYKMGSAARDAGMKPIAGNTGRYDNQVDALPCWSLFTEGHVMSDGRMTACGFDSTGDWSMGDLNNQSFMEVWHSGAFQLLRQEHIRLNVKGTKCENCNI